MQLFKHLIFPIIMALGCTLPNTANTRTDMEKIVSNTHQCSYPNPEIVADNIMTKERIAEVYENARTGRAWAIDSLVDGIITKAPKDGLCWLTNLADTGEVDYLNKMAYYRAIGDKQIQDIPQALAFYQQVLAKDGNNIPANLSLGEMYAKGYGVLKDEAKALSYFLKAAAPKKEEECLTCMHNYVAFYKVATAYHYGLGTPVNDKLALEYYKKLLNHQPEDDTAEQFLAKAQLYETGFMVKKSAKNMADNYFLAAVSGSQKAQYKVSELYRQGNGLPRDNDNADAWREVAKLNNSPIVDLYYF